MRLPGPVPGSTLSIVWSPPYRTLVKAKPGRSVRYGWGAKMYACALGYPDEEVGEAQAADRVTLRLMQAYGLTWMIVKVLSYRAFRRHTGEQEDPQ